MLGARLERPGRILYRPRVTLLSSDSAARVPLAPRVRRFTAVLLLTGVTIATLAILRPPVTSGQSSHRPGDVPWFGLLTTDAVAAVSFYGDLFGWELAEMSAGRYVISHDGALLGGITRIDSADEATWITGVVVDSLDDSLEATQLRGGRVLVSASEAPGLGRWAVIEDPEGAQILLIVPERQMGGLDAPGHWVWSELWTSAPEAAAGFYADVVGWEASTVDNLGGEYQAFLSGGRPRAGIVPIVRGDMEPGWAPYVAVADLDETLERAVALGGTVVFPPTDDVYQGRVAVIGDPTGVSFLAFALETGGGE